MKYDLSESRETPSESARPLRVCFFTPYALALFEPAQGGHFGGAEMRAARFARGIAASGGFHVTCAAFGAKLQTVDGVRLMPVPEPIMPPPAPPAPRGRHRRPLLLHAYLGFHAAGERINRFPYLRFHRFHWGLPWQVPYLAAHAAWRTVRRPLASLARRIFHRRQWLPEPVISPVFARAEFDAVCVFGANNPAANVVASCRAYGIPTILFLASDSDVSKINYPGSLELGPHCDWGHLCHLALTQADAVVAQTEVQRSLLAERFGREAVVIRNPWPGCPHEDDGAATNAGGNRTALWIGRAERANKRPELCIELARRCPDVPFTMILNPSEPKIFQQICDSAPENVTIVKSVPFGEIDAYFRRAAVLLNTSRNEGFPNTFLQAASHGVPILSLKVDPDGFLQRERCGAVFEDDLEAMAAELRRVFHDAAAARQLGEAGRHYVRRAHDLDGRVAELAALLRRVARNVSHDANGGHTPRRRNRAAARGAA